MKSKIHNNSALTRDILEQPTPFFLPQIIGAQDSEQESKLRGIFTQKNRLWCEFNKGGWNKI